MQGQVSQAVEAAKEILIRANSDCAQTEVWKVLKEHNAMIPGLSDVMEVLTKGTPIGRPGLYQMIATIGSMPASLRVPVDGKRLKGIPLLCRLWLDAYRFPSLLFFTILCHRWDLLRRNKDSIAKQMNWSEVGSGTCQRMARL